MSGGPTPIKPAQKSEAGYKAELVEIFNIPKNLLRDSGKTEGLHLYYQKYRACIKALSVSERMARDGEWLIRKPSETEIVELFVGKTMWHSHLKKFFSRVPKYPELLKWLKEEEDALPTIDIWGEDKTSFTFTDLKAWMDKAEEENNRVQGKGKGKAREDNKKGKKKGKKDDSDSDSDDSDKNKNKDKKKKKKKKKKEEGSSKKYYTRSKGNTE